MTGLKRAHGSARTSRNDDLATHGLQPVLQASQRESGMFKDVQPGAEYMAAHKQPETRTQRHAQLTCISLLEWGFAISVFLDSAAQTVTIAAGLGLLTELAAG